MFLREARHVPRGVEVEINPEERKKYLEKLLKAEGLLGLTEQTDAAYCPISLAAVPRELKDYVKAHQAMLVDVLNKAGIATYDPSTAPLSPDVNTRITPDEVYRTDIGKVVSSRFFVGFNILPSTGFGEELAMASQANRIPVMFMKKGLRLTRMLPPRAIYIEFNDFEKEIPNFIKIFEELKTWEPGVGFKDGKPALLGFRNNRVVVLQDLIDRLYPQYKYVYNPEDAMLEFHVSNPEVLTEVKVTG